MRLLDLHPQWRRRYRDFTPETGGIPTEDFDLSFDCPKCGAPRRVIIKVGPDAADITNHRWQFNMPPDGPDWPSKLTITPSIQMPAIGHGRNSPPCGWHGSIMNGEVTQ